MKIVHIVQRYLPAPLSGSERYMQLLSEGLSCLGHKVRVLTSSAYDWDALVYPFKRRIQKRIEKINGVEVERFPICYEIYAVSALLRFTSSKLSIESDLLNILTSGPFIPDLYFYVKDLDCDVVHATPFPFSQVWLSWLATRKAKTPFIVTPLLHIQLRKQYYNGYLRKVLEKSEAVIALTDIEKRVVVNLGAKNDKVHVIPLGIKVDDYRDVDGDRFKRKHGLEGKQIVLYVAPKVPDKGALQVLRAVREVQKYIPDVMLVAVGQRTAWWNREKISLNVRNVVDLEQLNENEKKDAFDSCDVFVMPSRVDSYGFVYLEAWIRGKPVIGARIGAMPDVIKDGTDGFLVKFGDSIELAERLLFLLKNPSIRERIGENGKQRVYRLNNWDTLLKKIEDLYNRIGRTPRIKL